MFTSRYANESPEIHQVGTQQSSRFVSDMAVKMESKTIVVPNRWFTACVNAGGTSRILQRSMFFSVERYKIRNLNFGLMKGNQKRLVGSRSLWRSSTVHSYFYNSDYNFIEANGCDMFGTTVKIDWCAFGKVIKATFSGYVMMDPSKWLNAFNRTSACRLLQRDVACPTTLFLQLSNNRILINFFFLHFQVTITIRNEKTFHTNRQQTFRSTTFIPFFEVNCELAEKLQAWWNYRSNA